MKKRSQTRKTIRIGDKVWVYGTQATVVRIKEVDGALVLYFRNPTLEFDNR